MSLALAASFSAFAPLFVVAVVCPISHANICLSKITFVLIPGTRAAPTFGVGKARAAPFVTRGGGVLTSPWLGDASAGRPRGAELGENKGEGDFSAVVSCEMIYCAPGERAGDSLFPFLF